VLWKGTNLRQLEYNAAPLRFSDHRPVYATFDCTISVVNEQLKENLSQGLYNKQRSVIGNVTANSRSDDSDDEDGVSHSPIAPGLPPTSSDRHKWWLNNGKHFAFVLLPPANLIQGSQHVQPSILPKDAYRTLGATPILFAPHPSQIGSTFLKPILPTVMVGS
jgi:hypothetical protein